MPVCTVVWVVARVYRRSRSLVNNNSKLCRVAPIMHLNFLISKNTSVSGFMMTALLLPLAAAGALLWAVMLRYGGLVAGCLVTLGAGVVLGYDLFHIGSITSDRLLLIVLLASFVVMRTLGQTNTYRLTRTDMVFGAFLAFLVFSTFTNHWRWSENYPVSRLLFYYVLPAGLYWIARQAKTTKDVLVIAFGSVAMLGVYLALTAIAETREWYGLIYPRYIFNSLSTEFFGRGRGPLLNPIGNGILLSISMVSTLMIWPHVRAVWRPLVAATAGVVLIGAYCTLTRSVWIGAAGCLGIVGLLTFPVRIRRLCIVFALLSGTIVLPVAYQKSKAFKRDKNVSVADMSSSASLRPIFFHVAKAMFRDRPIAGVGYGQYLRFNKNYLHDRSVDLRLDLAGQYQQHNIWLSLLVETGLIGMSLFTAMFVCWGRAGWQLWNSQAPLAMRQVGLLHLTLTFVYFVNGMFHELAIIPMVHMAYFCLAGLTVGLWLQYVVPAAEQRPVKVLPGTTKSTSVRPTTGAWPATH